MLRGRCKMMRDIKFSCAQVQQTRAAQVHTRLGNKEVGYYVDLMWSLLLTFNSQGTRSPKIDLNNFTNAFTSPHVLFLFCDFTSYLYAYFFIEYYGSKWNNICHLLTFPQQSFFFGSVKVTIWRKHQFFLKMKVVYFSRWI